MKISTKHILAIITTTVSAFLAVAPSSQAASISWSGAQNIAGNGDVNTNGTLVGAYNVGNTGVSSTTVNGVLFSSFDVAAGSTSVTNGNFTLDVSGSGNFLSAPNGTYGSSSAPFSALTSSYKTLLESATETSTPVTYDLIMVGLTVGQNYQFQWWANFSGPPFPGESSTTRATSVGGVNLLNNTTGLEGGTGQFAIGSFTANSTTQVINFSPVLGPGQTTGAALLNAFQLRSVPEPASMLVGMLPLGALLVSRYFRRGTAVSVKVS